MRILALDSSGLVATVAIVEEEQTVAEYTVNYKKTHSQTLLPMLDEIVKMTDMDLQTIDAIAIAGGPGSFTGLRIVQFVWQFISDLPDNGRKKKSGIHGSIPLFRGKIRSFGRADGDRCRRIDTEVK